MLPAVETAPLSQQDIALIKKKAVTTRNVCVFFIMALVIAGPLWAWLSGYYEPFYLVGGALILPVVIWWVVSKKIGRELKESQKTIYRGEVQKRMTKSGKRGENTTYTVTIGNEDFNNQGLYASFADGDEVEVHVSKVRKTILCQKIIQGTGNVEYKSNLPEEYQNEGYLTEEELGCLQALRRKRTYFYWICIFLVLASAATLEWLFGYWDMHSSNDKWTLRAYVWPVLALIAYVWYRIGIQSVAKDIRRGQKILYDTQIIDKESVTYKGVVDYKLKTPKRTCSVSQAGYDLFENRDLIQIQYTANRKTLIQIINRSDPDKVYRSEKFFKR